ncbi:unnamed protein product [Ostreobium quekettii]|uniref:TRP C-terminal domain-containing protein n=1 Tax=Ostreobium quekettii TaxID=121088 RepID=A0A8S1J0J6_9CHLO|nr:unnamed protein product [Ostreobium quekettii]
MGPGEVIPPRTGRRLLQGKGTQVRVDSNTTAGGVLDLFSNLTAGAEVILDAERIEIDGVLRVDVPNVLVTGVVAGREDGPTVLCVSGDAALEVRASGAKLSNFTIRNCTSTAIRIIKPPEENRSLISVEVRNVTFKDNNDSNSSAFGQTGGGGLSVDGASVNVTNCAFEGNGWSIGGGISAFNSNLTVLGSLFLGNTARLTGGAISADASTAPSETSLIIEGCNFTGNRDPLSQGALPGGVSVFSTDSRPLEPSNFVNFNGPAKSGGGAVFAQQFTKVRISESIFESNFAAPAGGALTLLDNMQVLVSGSTFRNNEAREGQVTLQAAQIVRNEAQGNGGGVAAVQSLASGIVSFLNANFISNLAKFGGAVHVDSVAKFRINGATNAFSNLTKNSALAGGAVYAQLRHPVANNLEISRTQFEHNTVVGTLEAVGFELVSFPRRNPGVSKPAQSASELMDSIDTAADNPCTPGGGGAICLALTRIAERVTIVVDIKESRFADNSASTGGGLFIGTARGASWRAPNTCGMATGDSDGFATMACRELGLQDLNFTNNAAENSGSDIFASYPHDVWIADKGRLSKFSTLAMAREGMTDIGQRASIASAVSRLSISSGLQTNGFLVKDHPGGEFLPTVTVTVLDAYNQTILAGVTDSSLLVTATGNCSDGKDCVTGQRRVSAENGVATFDAISVVTSPGTYSLSFGAEGVDPVTANFSIRKCRPGEVSIRRGAVNVCRVCDANEYSFSPEVECRDCDSRATCPGRAALVPLDGFWHSSPFSTQLHRCLVHEACSFVLEPVVDGNWTRQERSTILGEFYVGLELEVVKEANETMKVFSNEEYQQCRKGYQGVLCASCEPRFGHLPGGECIKCTEDQGLTVFYTVLIFLWSLVLVTIAIRSAQLSIKNLAEARAWTKTSFNTRSGRGSYSEAEQSASLPTATEGATIAVSVPAPETKSEGGAATSLASTTSMSHSRKPIRSILDRSSTQATALPVGIAECAPGDQEVSIIHIIAAEKISETLKIATNFLQVTGIAVTINADWTASVKRLLGVWDTLVAFSNSSSLFSMDCALSEGGSVPRSIRGTIFRIFFPALIYIAISSVIFALYRRQLKRNPSEAGGFLRSRLVISALALTFFSYHSISEEFMRTLNCVTLDDPNKDVPELRGFAIARGRFWAEDTAEVCFNGDHALLAFLLGVPGLLAFSLGVPAVLLFVLLRARRQGRLTDPKFLNSFGFVYQNYTETHVYWEVVILTRKACVGAVVVFGYEAGSNLQGIMALGLLIVALVVHTVALPFKYDALNLAEGFSILVSILTFYSGIVFNDENTSTVAETLLSILVYIANLGVIVALLYMLLRYLDVFTTAKLVRRGLGVPSTLPGRLSRLVFNAARQSKMLMGVAACLGCLLRMGRRGRATGGAAQL